MKEEFKSFVRKKPELIKYVNSGETSWQQLYEKWSLYGEDEKIWEEYNIKSNNEEIKENETFNFSSIIDMVKKVDMNQVQKGVNSLQKIIELLQGFSLKDNNSSTTKTYEPRQLFKKFED